MVDLTSETTRDLTRHHEVSRYDVIGARHEGLDDLVRLVAELTGVPSAAINLMQSGSQATVAAVGMSTGMCAREDSMCHQVLHLDEPVEVSDTLADPRWSDNPWVNGELDSFRFYYAHQLVSPRGVVVGTLCLFDYVPRRLDDEQRFKVARVAAWIMDTLELRLRTFELEETVTELTAARTELQRSNEMLDLFAGQIAHDLRGPVAALNLTLGMLREEVAEEHTDQSWLVDRALGSVSRMDTLIGDMLAFASLGTHLNAGEADLTELIEMVRVDLGEELDRVRLVADRLPVVPGGATQWRVVLQNLVTNAVKFTRHLEAPLVRVSAGTDSWGWWLEVADNGPGVPVADRERVFGLMTQGDPAKEGIGLGLATCARIVQAHGGSIRITEAPEGGALLRLTVPVLARAASPGRGGG
jgi:signal transduction histidine kinase